MEWISENWDLISAVAGALLSVASIIVGLTDTPLDNTVLGIIQRILGRISFVQPRDAEGSLKMPGTSAARPVSFLSMRRK
jgi:hypothetical protein